MPAHLGKIAAHEDALRLHDACIRIVRYAIASSTCCSHQSVLHRRLYTRYQTDELARRIGAEEPVVRDALVTALDDWGFAASQCQTRWSATGLLGLAWRADSSTWEKRHL